MLSDPILDLFLCLGLYSISHMILETTCKDRNLMRVNKGSKNKIKTFQVLNKKDLLKMIMKFMIYDEFL